jgi:F-type H+-transporting ATPase subunit delta
VADDRIGGYADALLAVAAAEGASDVVEDELFRVAEAVRSNDNLLATLSDRNLPVERRQGVVEDLLGSSAHPTTTALVSMVVGTGRGADLPAIVDETVARSAAGRNATLARVRSAIDLTDDQKSRLAAAIKSKTGSDVEIRVVIDESVLGGVITEIGDDVIDGSVRSRMTQLRESFS